MGLLGKFFKGPGEKDENVAGRSKRGRAPSIRTPGEGSGPGALPGLPEINLDDLEKSRQAQPPAQTPGSKRGAAPPPAPAAAAAPAPKAAEKPAIDLDPAPAKAPAAPARPAPKPAASAPAPAPAPAAASGGDGLAKRPTRLQSRQKPIGELLIQAGSVSTEQLSRALKIQDKGGKGLVGQIMVNMGACQQAAILAGLNRQFRISTVELERVEIPPVVAALVPQEKCREHRLVPFEKLGNTLCISMANCLNRKAINEVEELTKLKVKPFNSTWIEIRKALDVLAKSPAAAAAAPAEAPAGAPEAAPEPAAQSIEPSAPAPIAVEAAPAPSPAPEPAKASPAKAQEPADAEPAPFVGPARARIEGLDTLDSSEAEVVQETERGLASKHLDEIRRRRTERQKLMGTGKGVVGRLVAPGLEDYRPEGSAAEPAEEPESSDAADGLVTLRLVEEDLLAGSSLPVARELASNVEAFSASKEAPPAASPAPARELEPAPAEAAHAVMPAVPTIDFKPEEAGVASPAALSDAEWAALEPELEPDPVVAWQATYASAGPVPAALSWL
ncbi:MAG TPA: hypothetical protein PK280_08480 [Planctomycetota bacterium]|nr:hypothetical protein [Planctomycetota bacterium]